MRLTKKAFSMIEILFAICIFTLMVLPMLFLASSQNRNAYSVTKHLIANQIASTFLDEIMAKTYNEVIKDYQLENITETEEKGSLLDHHSVQEIINNIKSDESKKELEKDLASFVYSMQFNLDKTLKILYIRIKVTYSVFDNKTDANSQKANITLECLKHGYKFPSELTP